MRLAKNPALIGMAVFAGFAIVFYGAGADGWGMAAANESPIGQASRWCERVASGWLREPVNTLGNFGFVIAGMAMLLTLRSDENLGRPKANPFLGISAISILYATASLWLGPGSMAMHGTHTTVGAWLDNTSMVAFILVPWIYNVSRLGSWRLRRFFVVYAGLLALYAAGFWLNGPDLGIGMDLFGLSIALWVISETVYRFPRSRWWSGFVGFVVAGVFGITPVAMWRSPGEFWWVIFFWVPGLLYRNPAPGRRRYWWFWVGMTAFGLAYAIWLTGTDDHPWCDPDSVYQAHALWHLLSALATWSFFKFLRTERGAPSDVRMSLSPTSTTDVTRAAAAPHP